jgi:hypothetical protein
MDRWPELHYADWAATQTTLHLWTQIVGKIRLRLSPFVNHWWNVTLYVTPRGLSTGSMPYADGRLLSISFDFLDHALHIDDSDGTRGGFALVPMSVAAFYERTMEALNGMGVRVGISARPNEIAEATPFPDDREHAAYDAAAVERFFLVLAQAYRLCTEFRSGFTGKASPVHFFWGSFDLAQTRFSGRPAPPHPGGIPNMPDAATREAYSREEHSVGFWPGGPGADALFYAYAYPEPKGFKEARIAPPQALWFDALREFVLPYDAVRAASDRDGAVLDFFRSTYDAAASLAGWDRSLLDR